MAEHTPEPWRAGFTTDGEIVVRAEAVDGQPYICLLVGDATRANAERIVASINFCAGTASEYLAGAGTLDRMLATAGAGVNADLLAACQEMLAASRSACQEMLAALDEYSEHGILTGVDTCRSRLRDAIARATAK